MRNLNDRYGLASFDVFAATQERALGTAGRAVGTMQVAGVTMRDVVGDLDAGRAPETQILRARWAEELRPVWGLLGGSRVSGPVGGQVVAWMDSALRLTVIATRDVDGTVLVSMAAHHDEHGRVPLPDGEVDFWVPVLFTPAQLLHMRRRGAQSGIGGPEDPIEVLTTEYFHYTPPPALR
jgi:hypothetical protein